MVSFELTGVVRGFCTLRYGLLGVLGLVGELSVQVSLWLVTGDRREQSCMHE